MIDNLPNVAFKAPDGRKVLVVLNESVDTQVFNIEYEGKAVTVNLEGGLSPLMSGNNRASFPIN